jgi:hypothetical protein
MLSRFKYLFASVFVLAAIQTRAWSEESITFKLTPPSAKLFCHPGDRVGWGYVVRNNSDRYWLVTKNLNTDAFRYGTPAALFDFPSLPPGGVKAIPYAPSQRTGLYEFTWESAAPDGFSNAGEFILDSEWWSGDPLNGGKQIGSAPRTSATYETATSSGGASRAPENAAPASGVYERQKIQQHQWATNYLADYKSPLSVVLHPSRYLSAVLVRMVFFSAAYAIWLPFGVLIWRKWRHRFSSRPSRSLFYALIFTPSLGAFPYIGWWIGPVWTSIGSPFFGVLSSLAAGLVIWLMGLWSPGQRGSFRARLTISTPAAMLAGLFAGDWIFGGAKTIVQTDIAGMDFYRLLSIFQCMTYTTILAWVIAFRDPSNGGSAG